MRHFISTVGDDSSEYETKITKSGELTIMEESDPSVDPHAQAREAALYYIANAHATPEGEAPRKPVASGADLLEFEVVELD